jgi:hypothetical protein
VIEDGQTCAPSLLSMKMFRFIPSTWPRKERASTLDVVDALRYTRGTSTRWDDAVRVLARKLDLPTLEAEVMLLRALADPRDLVVGLCSRQTGACLVQVPRRKR